MTGGAHNFLTVPETVHKACFLKFLAVLSVLAHYLISHLRLGLYLYVFVCKKKKSTTKPERAQSAFTMLNLISSRAFPLMSI